MSAVRESPVLQKVAEPPVLAYVPFTIVAMYMAISLAVWLISFVVFELSMIWLLIWMVTLHIILWGMAAKDIHLETTWRSIGTYSRKPRNIVSSKHKKYVP